MDGTPSNCLGTRGFWILLELAIIKRLSLLDRVADDILFVSCGFILLKRLERLVKSLLIGLSVILV